MILEVFTMKNLLLMAAMAALVFACSTPAQASLVLALDSPVSGGFDVIVADNQAAGTLTSGGLLTTAADGNPAVGAVSFSGPVGVFDINVDTGLSKPILGPAVIDLNFTTHSTTGGTLLMALTDTDFNQVGSNAVTQHIGGTIHAGAGTSISSAGY